MESIRQYTQKPIWYYGQVHIHPGMHKQHRLQLLLQYVPRVWVSLLAGLSAVQATKDVLPLAHVHLIHHTMLLRLQQRVRHHIDLQAAASQQQQVPFLLRQLHHSFLLQPPVEALYQSPLQAVTTGSVLEQLLELLSVSLPGSLFCSSSASAVSLKLDLTASSRSSVSESGSVDPQKELRSSKSGTPDMEAGQEELLTARGLVRVDQRRSPNRGRRNPAALEAWVMSGRVCLDWLLCWVSRGDMIGKARSQRGQKSVVHTTRIPTLAQVVPVQTGEQETRGERDTHDVRLPVLKWT